MNANFRFMVISAIRFAHVSLARVYTIRSPFGETVPIAFNSVVMMPIDAPSSTALARVKPLYVRAYEGRKADLRDVTKHERDPRTHCVKYYYHFRAPASWSMRRLRFPDRTRRGKMAQPVEQRLGSGRPGGWVLIRKATSRIHEDLIDDYFGGGVQITSRRPPLLRASARQHSLHGFDERKHSRNVSIYVQAWCTYPIHNSSI